MSDLDVVEKRFKVKTASFEGPFGLLLSLVEARKLFISDVSLAQVTEDYIYHVNNIAKEDKEEIANFILVAATLILIKSKSLLPDLVLSSEEEKDIEILEQRLKLYDLYNSLGVHLRERFGKQIIFSPRDRGKSAVVFVPDSQINIQNLQQTIDVLINKLPAQGKLPEVQLKKVISLEEMITKLTERIESKLKLNFQDFVGKAHTKEDRVSVIVGFLAMLELIRTGILEAIQDENFADIIIEKQSNNESI